MADENMRALAHSGDAVRQSHAGRVCLRLVQTETGQQPIAPAAALQRWIARGTWASPRSPGRADGERHHAGGRVSPAAATAGIATGQAHHALVVPNRAVRTQNGNHYVYILKDGQVTQVAVTLGTSSNANAEIFGGNLHEGDAVILNPPASLVSSNGG